MVTMSIGVPDTRKTTSTRPTGSWLSTTGSGPGIYKLLILLAAIVDTLSTNLNATSTLSTTTLSTTT